MKWVVCCFMVCFGWIGLIIGRVGRFEEGSDFWVGGGEKSIDVVDVLGKDLKRMWFGFWGILVN